MTKIEPHVIKGKIWYGPFGENDSALMVGYNSTPFAKRFDDFFYNCKVTVRYWITDVEMDRHQLMEENIKRISGSIEARYSDAYSEYTGYLWTTENAKVGGHDILGELQLSKDKFLYMEIEKNI